MEKQDSEPTEDSHHHHENQHDQNSHYEHVIETDKNSLKVYLFLLWDGLNFFGFDERKIHRIRGQKPKWYDKCRNKRYLTLRIILVIIAIALIIAESKKLGDVKS